MKPFVIVFSILIIFVLFGFEKVESQNNRLWLEIGKELYFVEPEGRYTWKQAAAACKKVQSRLIRLKGGYNYAKLKDAISRNFRNYSSFWSSAQVKYVSFFHYFGLGVEEYNRQKCYKFDNSSAFKSSPENCSSRLGFICEKALLQSESLFNTKNMLYFVQPKQNFNCKQAYQQCENRHMRLVLGKDQENNKLLKDFLFINYGSAINFWYGFSNATHYNCETTTTNPNVKADSELGFICQRERDQKHTLTGRHIILLIFVAVVASIALIVFLIIKFCWLKKLKTFDVPHDGKNKECMVTDIE